MVVDGRATGKSPRGTRRRAPATPRYPPAHRDISRVSAGILKREVTFARRRRRPQAPPDRQYARPQHDVETVISHSRAPFGRSDRRRLPTVSARHAQRRDGDQPFAVPFDELVLNVHMPMSPRQRRKEHPRRLVEHPFTDDLDRYVLQAVCTDLLRGRVDLTGDVGTLQEDEATTGANQGSGERQ